MTGPSVIVTGATGFIGRHVLPQLAAAGYEVHALTSKEPPRSSETAARWHRVDILDEDETRRFVAGLQAAHLLHLAWYAEPGQFWTSLQNFSWLRASVNLFEAFAAAGGRRIVGAGTCAEYDWDFGFCSEGLTPCRPATAYGVCKHALYQTLIAFGVAASVSVAWGRIFLLYGPHEHRARLVPGVVVPLLAGETAVCTPGTQIRDFLHVADVASAFVRLLDSTLEGAVNIASGLPLSVRDIVTAAAAELDAVERVRFGGLPARAADPPCLLADVRRLRDELGWKPRYDLISGLRDTIRYWSSRGTLDPRDD